MGIARENRGAAKKSVRIGGSHSDIRVEKQVQMSELAHILRQEILVEMSAVFKNENSEKIQVIENGVSVYVDIFERCVKWRAGLCAKI